jgi:hypothetical protein
VAEIDLDDVRRAQQRGEGISPRADRRTDVYALMRVGESTDGRGGTTDFGTRSDSVLEPRVAALVDLASLIAQGADEAELVRHMRAALEAGASGCDVQATLMKMPDHPPAGKALARVFTGRTTAPA